MSPNEPISWDQGPGEFTGDIGSALAVDAQRWTKLGARFTPVADGEGEEPGLAVGNVETASQRLRFGILDYGEAETFLLVPATGSAKVELAQAVIETLLELGVLTASEVMDEPSPYKAAGTLYERIEALERSVGETLAEANLAAEPVAVDVAVVSIGKPFSSGISVIKKRWYDPEKFYTFGDHHYGTIKAFDPGDGMVYIEPDDGSKRISVREGTVVDAGSEELREGAKVVFRYGIDRKDRRVR